MSTASVVPETRGLPGPTPADTLRQVATRDLLHDTVVRLRAADGFSHARATAFQIALVMIPGTIVLVAVSALARWQQLSRAVSATFEAIAPGRAGEIFREAVDHGRDAAGRSDVTALVLGSAALVVSATTLFGQVERTSNRIYGVEQDRPSVHKYARAALMTLTAGTLVVVHVLLVSIGGGLGRRGDTGDDETSVIWDVARWPLGFAVLTAALLIILRHAPRRRPPELVWLLTGALVSAGLTLAATALLHLYLQGSGNVGDTYGPLAGVLGLLVWSYACALTLVAGIALNAQLEAVRGGRPAPQSETKADDGDVDGVTVGYGAATRGASS